MSERKFNIIALFLKQYSKSFDNCSSNHPHLVNYSSAPFFTAQHIPSPSTSASASQCRFSPFRCRCVGVIITIPEPVRVFRFIHIVAGCLHVFLERSRELHYLLDMLFLDLWNGRTGAFTSLIGFLAIVDCESDSCLECL